MDAHMISAPAANCFPAYPASWYLFGPGKALREARSHAKFWAGGSSRFARQPGS